jgi:glycosyltransferase involved in cell wall biosynthesis
MSYPFPFASSEQEASIPTDQPARGWRPSTILGAARRRRGRRLAVVDTHFPWQISGFRYSEFLELYRCRPDTLFFSMYELNDPFPVRAIPLGEFPRVALRAGITDVYLVFLNIAIAILGLHDEPGAADVEGVHPISLRRTLEALRIRVHAHLYPGGGLLTVTPPSLVRAVGERCTTVFTNVDEVERVVPHAHFVPMLVGADAYPFRAREPGESLRLVFVGDDRPRKGIRTVIEAFNLLPEGFELDIVGPNERYSDLVRRPGCRFHGWVEPTDLVELYWRADVFVSPSAMETEDEAAIGMIDGFPTTAAAEAMAAGCALVGSNPRQEFRGLRPEREYIEIPERDPEALARALLDLRADRERIARIAVQGAARVREFSTEVVVPWKLEVMGLGRRKEPSRRPGRPDHGLPGSRLSPDTRARIEAIVRSIPTDIGGGTSLTKALVVGDLILEHGLSRVVEIGVYRGAFLLPAAVVLQAARAGRALGIDPYSPEHAAQSELESVHPGLADEVEQWLVSTDWDQLHRDVVESIAAAGLADVCAIDRRPSAEAAGDIPDESVDVLHLDGNHDRRHVEEDLDLYLPKLRDGRFLIVDDLSWPAVSAAVAERVGTLELVLRLRKPDTDDFAIYRYVRPRTSYETT